MGLGWDDGCIVTQNIKDKTVLRLVWEMFLQQHTLHKREIFIRHHSYTWTYVQVPVRTWQGGTASIQMAYAALCAPLSEHLTNL